VWHQHQRRAAALGQRAQRIHRWPLPSWITAGYDQLLAASVHAEQLQGACATPKPAERGRQDPDDVARGLDHLLFGVAAHDAAVHDRQPVGRSRVGEQPCQTRFIGLGPELRPARHDPEPASGVGEQPHAQVLASGDRVGRGG